MTISRRAGVTLLMAAVIVLVLQPFDVTAQYNITCGGNPPPPHVNGLGQAFNDCSPLGVPGSAATYSQTLAAEARAAWPNAGTDANATASSPTRDQAVYRQTTNSCAVWAYTGPNAGHVRLNTANKNCYFP